MKITANDLIEINKEFGGHLRSDSSIRFAESNCKNIKSKYKNAAIWIRAIIIDHPFTDANKRTALFVLIKLIKIKDEDKITRAIIRIAKENISDLDKIVEVLQNANR